MKRNGFKFRRRAVSTLAAAALSAIFTGGALAATIVWDGGGANANWDTAANWNGDTVPPTTADVQFASAFTSGTSVSTNGNRTANSLIINTITGFTLNGAAGDVLTLTSGNITRNDIAGTEANQFINPDIALGANGAWTIGGSNSLQINGVISGSGRSLTKGGTGTLIFNSGSNYSGGTFLNAGILQLNTSGAGTGAITVANGAELAIDSATVANTINLNGGGTLGTGALRGITTSTLSGAVTLQSNSAINTVAGILTLSGVISDGASSFNLTKNGAAELRLSGANSYNGTTTVNAGTLTVSNNSALGSSSVSVVSGASVGVLSGVSINVPLTLNGVATTSGALFGDSGTTSWQGPITLGSNSNIGVTAGTLTIGGAIGQSSSGLGLTKVGAGTLVLAAANTYTGPTNINAGIVVIGVPPAIQQSSAVNVVSGAELDLGGGGITSVPLTLAGSGVGGNGAIRGLSGATQWSGPITASSNITIGSVGSMLLSGAINVPGTITKVGAGSVSFSNAANSFNGLVVNAGTLTVPGEAGIPASSLIDVADGAMAQLSAGITVNRSLKLNGDGPLGNFALVTGTSTWAGPVKFAANSTIYSGGNLTISGNIDGVGMTLTKEGPGKLILSGVNLFASANVTTGTLSLTSSTSGPASSVTVTDIASFELSNAGTISAVAAHISGNGAGGGGALRGVNGNSTWAGTLTLDTDSSVFVDAGSQLTLSGTINGASSILTKTGQGTLVLSGFNTNSTGGTIVNEGTVSIADDGRLGGGAEVTINGGRLLFTSSGSSARDYNLTNGRLQTNVVTTLTGHIRGGFLMGPGTFVAGSGAVFSGVTSFAGSNISVNGTAFLEAFSNGGAMATAAALSWDGGINSSSGAITVQSNTLTTTAFTNDGVITINNGATLQNSGNTLTSGGGSRITINSGGTLNVSGNALNLNGALLVNNGTVTGTTNVNFGSLAKGAGVYGAVNVTDGGRFSPGNSPGTVTTGSTNWNSGGGYLVELGQAASDFWQVNGELSLNASAQHPFTVSLASLDGLIFDNTRDYTWPILHAEHGIAGLDVGNLVLDVSEFKKSFGSGQFTLESSRTDLAVHFSAVPEPAAFGLVAVAACLARRRRR